MARIISVISRNDTAETKKGMSKCEINKNKTFLYKNIGETTSDGQQNINYTYISRYI